MQGNIYDDQKFFEAYAGMPRSKNGLASAGEWRQLQLLFPNIEGKRVLDLGCGYGWHCQYAVEMGAAYVLGLDGSEKMIERALSGHSHKRIAYRLCSLDAYDYPREAYDLVLSNLVLHYIEDLETVYRNVHKTLKRGGCFLFNIEHPVFTAGVNQDWIYDGQGNVLYWAIDRYFYPGERTTNFLGEKVKKQHHTLTQILNPLMQKGFQIEAVEEAMPPEEMMDLPGMKEEMRRPMMLLVKAKKP